MTRNGFDVKNLVCRDRRGFWIAIGFVALLAGFMLKIPCLANSWDGVQYRSLCYSDVQALYEQRGLDEDRVPYLEEFNEYPVGTGFAMFGAAKATSTPVAYTIVVYLLLFAAGMVAVVGVVSLASASAWRFVAAPSFVLVAFLNWDLLAVACAVAGWWIATRRRWWLAGAVLGLGAAIKFYPALLAPALAFVPWPWRDDAVPTARGETSGAGWRRAGGVVGGFLITWIGLNLPVLIAAPTGWLDTWMFHARRLVDFDTVWFWASRSFDVVPGGADLRDVADTVFRVGMVVGLVGVVWLSNSMMRDGHDVWRTRTTVALACIVVFLLLSKVFSPQYTLWLLPFFALAAVPWQWWVVYEASVVAVVVARFQWFATAPALESNGWSALFGVATVVRTVTLIALIAWIVWQWRRREQIRSDIERGKTREMT